jgi:hypothetical protein
MDAAMKRAAAAALALAVAAPAGAAAEVIRVEVDARPVEGLPRSLGEWLERLERTGVASREPVASGTPEPQAPACRAWSSRLRWAGAVVLVAWYECDSSESVSPALSAVWSGSSAWLASSERWAVAVQVEEGDPSAALGLRDLLQGESTRGR